MLQSLFPSWTKGSSSLLTLIDYIASVTDPTKSTFIPVEDRIAVFDMDGTIVSESLPYMSMCVYWTYRAIDDPEYHASERELQVALRLRDCMVNHQMEHFDFSEDEVTYWMDTAFAGLTMEQYRAHATNWLHTTYSHDKYNLPYSQLFYRPMLELIAYLRQNHFQIYILSASDREFCRAMVCQPLLIPPSHVIGYTVNYRAEQQGDAESRNYAMQPNEKVIRTNTSITFNDRFSKVESIINEIGQRPVLAFGNSSGDFAMFHYVISNRTDPYQGRAYCLLCDDVVRENGDLSRAKRYYLECQKQNFLSISMNSDWQILF